VCFNGATSFRTWKRCDRPGLPFPLIASMGPRPFGHGNGPPQICSPEIGVLLQWGHVLSDMETCGRHHQARAYDAASMGPRPFGHGNYSAETNSRATSTGFNGATSFRTWKPYHDAGRLCHRDASFNGATSFRTWKQTIRRQVTIMRKCFNGATSFRTWKLRYHRYRRAGPTRFNGATSFRTWKRGLSFGHIRFSIGFNGATSFRTWKLRAAWPQNLQLRYASMGPRPFGHGNPGHGLQGRRYGCKLQWGHVLSDMETLGGVGHESSTNSFASMGPRPFGHGNERVTGARGEFYNYRFNGATSFRTWKRMLSSS